MKELEDRQELIKRKLNELEEKLNHKYETLQNMKRCEQRKSGDPEGKFVVDQVLETMEVLSDEKPSIKSKLAKTLNGITHIETFLHAMT